MATIKNPVTIVKSGGGGGVTKPTTWAEFKAMTATQLKTIWPEGAKIDIECKVAGLSDWAWVVMEYGTCKIENDNTNYPCVTLLANRPFLNRTFTFDVRERVLASQSTEPTAVAGTNYYGISTSSGNPSSSNTTALNLSAGDAIPYSDYPRIYKNSANLTAAQVSTVWVNGYNNYQFSNIRQWLNSDGIGNAWFTPSHPGDSSPSYSNIAGFLREVPSDFLNVVSSTQVECALNTLTDGGNTVVVYDKFFLPSALEMRCSTASNEGAAFKALADASDRTRSHNSLPSDGGSSEWLLRSCVLDSVQNVYLVATSGAQSYAQANYSAAVVPACRIILAGS